MIVCMMLGSVAAFMERGDCESFYIQLFHAVSTAVPTLR